MKIPTIFDDEYQGQRFTYGLNYRPLDFASVPRGYIIGSAKENSAFKFGTIDYPFELTSDLVAGFELTAVAK